VCHVAILDKYLSKIPAEAKDNDVFYLTPLQCVPVDQAKLWFKRAPVGKNRSVKWLAERNVLLKEMSEKANLTILSKPTIA